MDLQEGGGEKKPQGALDSDKNHWVLFVNVKSCMLFYLEEHENRLMFQGKAKDMCATAQRKSLLRKLKLICISHCAHIQTCPKPYIEITQIHKTCATNTACTHTHTHQPFHLNLTPHNTHSPPTHISMYPPAAPQQCPHKGKSILFFIKNTVIPVVPSHGSEHIF